jgi:hypothetical protein
MHTIHCDICGGMMYDEASISYRLATGTVMVAVPHSGLCTCPVPVVYGPPPGFASMPAVPSVRVLRSNPAVSPTARSGSSEIH